MFKREKTTKKQRQQQQQQQPPLAEEAEEAAEEAAGQAGTGFYCGVGERPALVTTKFKDNYHKQMEAILGCRTVRITAAANRCTASRNFSTSWQLLVLQGAGAATSLTQPAMQWSF